MADLKQMSALTALNAMMAKSYFDICVIDRVAELLNVTVRGGDAYQILAPLHCVDWQKMPAELREAVPDLIKECLGVAPVFQFKVLEPQVIEMTPSEPKRGGFMRLIGR